MLVLTSLASNLKKRRRNNKERKNRKLVHTLNGKNIFNVLTKHLNGMCKFVFESQHKVRGIYDILELGLRSIVSLYSNYVGC